MQLVEYLKAWHVHALGWNLEEPNPFINQNIIGVHLVWDDSLLHKVLSVTYSPRKFGVRNL